MKILLANKFFYLKGGAEKSFFTTAELLQRHGHKVIFFSMKHPKNFSSKYEKYFINQIDYEKGGMKNKLSASLKLLYSFEAKKKIEELIKKEKPDLAHLNVIYHQISPSILHSLRKFNIPIVMSLRDYKMVCASYRMLANGNVCEDCKNGKYYKCFLNKCVKNSRLKSLLNTIEMYLHHKILHIYDLVDVFISPSMFLKNKLKEMGFKGKIEYLPNFVHLEEYVPNYNCGDYIVYFGRLSREKGLFTLLDAVKGLNVKLKIIGDGPIKMDLIQKVKEEKISNVEFLGYMSGEKLKEQIKNSMFIVLPSECYENNPRSVIEAFALGKPVVGANIGGIPELVKDGETGYLFEPTNVNDLKNKLNKALENKKSIIKMGKNAKKIVEENLNENRYYTSLLRIYDIIK